MLFLLPQSLPSERGHVSVTLISFAKWDCDSQSSAALRQTKTRNVALYWQELSEESGWGLENKNLVEIFKAEDMKYLFAGLYGPCQSIKLL